MLRVYFLKFFVLSHSSSAKLINQFLWTDFSCFASASCEQYLLCYYYFPATFLDPFVVKSLSHFWLFAAPWTAAHQASLSITNSWSLHKLMSIALWYHPTISSSVIPFSHLQSFPASGSFPRSQFFTLGGQTIGVSASESILPVNIKNWFSLGWTGWISLQSKGLSRVFSNPAVQKRLPFNEEGTILMVPWDLWLS